MNAEKRLRLELSLRENQRLVASSLNHNHNLNPPLPRSSRRKESQDSIMKQHVANERLNLPGSAGWQPAVSQIGNLQKLASHNAYAPSPVANRRYSRLPIGATPASLVLANLSTICRPVDLQTQIPHSALRTPHLIEPPCVGCYEVLNNVRMI